MYFGITAHGLYFFFILVHIILVFLNTKQYTGLFFEMDNYYQLNKISLCMSFLSRHKFKIKKIWLLFHKLPFGVIKQKLIRNP